MNDILSNRLWIGLLIGSVLINGVLLGVTLNRSLDRPNPVSMEDNAPNSLGRFNPRAFIMALPEEDREAGRDRLMAGRDDMRSLMQNVMQTRRQVWALINAEDFDAQAVQAAMDDVRQARSELEAHGERVVLEIVSALDREERQEALRGAYSGRGEFGRRRPGHDRRRSQTP